MKINIIGRGNVATHLLKAFSLAAYAKECRSEVTTTPVQVNPHTLEGFDCTADVTLICVKDDAIAEIIAKLPEYKGIIAHTSGSTPVTVFNEAKPGAIEKFGVFYPLQTFSKENELNYSEIPVFIEASNPAALQSLKELASTFTDKIFFADSEKRKALHIASVFACNFVNHLWGTANEILKESGISFDVLEPLIKETLSKALISKNPYSVQTGPAIRRDAGITGSHLEYLRHSPQLQEIYQILTQSIQRCPR